MPIPNIQKTGRSDGNKRWTAINLMRDMKGESPQVVCTAIFDAGRKCTPSLYISYGQVVSRYYNWAIQNGWVEEDYPMHPTRGGMVPLVYSMHYEKPLSYDAAIEALRVHFSVQNPNKAAIIQLMRDISNFDVIGRTADLSTLKQYNPNLSQGAYDFRTKCYSFHDWDKATTNEHSTPIKVMLGWIFRERDSRTNDEIKRYVEANPVCTILWEENGRIPNHYRSCGTREVRYPAAGIIIIKSPIPPYQFWN